ncbi:unnamed protein product [Moneuplotes crassus]|uniref:Cytosolic endo-beta-N-acetylglucosaminidase TIM barrel domain-containing protein n=1 Tax=Euplotes crassus TaxID=5936 RepID=A0AAD1XHZ4_EUPCR|nr:unnamed protein product [Moneuplotes crassus]
MEPAILDQKSVADQCCLQDSKITIPYNSEAKELTISCQVYIPERNRDDLKPLICFSHQDISHKIQVFLSHGNSLTFKIFSDEPKDYDPENTLFFKDTEDYLHPDHFNSLQISLEAKESKILEVTLKVNESLNTQCLNAPEDTFLLLKCCEVHLQSFQYQCFSLKPLEPVDPVQGQICQSHRQAPHNNYSMANFDPEHFSHQVTSVPYIPRKEAETLEGGEAVTGKRKVLVCHDIPKGINEDDICFNNFNRSKGYRFEHWENIDTFVYFSHNRLTVPPAAWITQAHKHGVKILGTLIFEWDDGKRGCKEMLDGVLTYQGKVIDEDLGALFYAEKLCEIAKFFKFDGYLMNFESDIPQEYVEKALQFLEYLKMRLKDEVGSHSELCWYDSVITTDGKVRWQSALRECNKAFFDVCDTFFTDYHWRPNYLDESLLLAGDRSYDIYYGNDIYGRGTYGGGIFNTHVALNEICKRPLSIALFATAYFYENNYESLERSEAQFWRGNQVVTFQLPNKREHLELTKLEDGSYTGVGQWNNIEGDLKIEEDENFGEYCVTSHMWCTRVFELPLDPIKQQLGLGENCLENLEKLEFEVMIKGTPPKCEDLYTIFVQIYDSNGRELADHNSMNSKAQKVATEDWVFHKVVLTKKDLFGTNASRIIITERGKDVEYWAGHFGTRFAKEKLALTFSEGSSETGSTRNIKKILGTRKTPIHLPFSTNFNNSMGDRFYFEGKIIRDKMKFYNYNDCSYVAPTDHGVLKTTASQDFAYYGTSCLKIKGTLGPQEECKIVLHETDFNIPDGEILIETLYAILKGREDLEISVCMQDSSQGHHYLPLIQTEEAKIDNKELTWFSNKQSLSIDSSSIISSLCLLFKNTSSTITNILTYIGQLTLTPPSYTPTTAITNLRYKTTTRPITSPLFSYHKVELEWDHIHTPHSSKTTNTVKFLLWRETQFLGVTTLTKFIDEQVRVEHEAKDQEEGHRGKLKYRVRVKVVVIGEALEKSEPVEVELE